MKESITIQNIKLKIVPISKSEGVLRSALFGSVVRGEMDADSDVDILVDLPRGKTLLDLVGLKLKLEEKLEKKVDVVTYSSLSPYLKEIILKERIPIYGEG